MSNTAVTLPNTFANQSGTIQLALLDQNFSPLANAFNALSTFSNYFLDTSGAANVITVTVGSPLTFGYTAGIMLQVKLANTNTSGTVVINVNALGNQNVKNLDGSNPGIGQLVAGGVYTFIYDGTSFQVQSGSASALTSAAFANPTASIGLSAVNGSATTAMRSDASPALSQAISPTWSGTHTFSNPITVNGASSSLKGNVSIAAPASSTSLTVNILDNVIGVNLLGGTPTSGFQVRWQDSSAVRGLIGYGPNVVVGGALTDFGVIGNSALFFSANGGASKNITINSTGNVAVNAPSSGVALSITGTANQNTQLIAGAATSGQSFGLTISAGTTSADWALNATNQSGSTPFFRVRGDGLTQAVDQGGTLQDVGWRGTPVNAPGTNYTAVLSDRGKIIAATPGTTITIPANVFSGGDVVSILIGSGGTVTIAQGTSLTLEWAGNGSNTGNRTLTGAGLATVVFFNATTAFISGAGLT